MTLHGSFKNFCNFYRMFSSLRNLVEKPPITGKEIASLSASAMVGFKLAPGPVPDHYRMFDQVRDQMEELQVDKPESSYQEFGKNFDDSEEIKSKHRKKYKRSLEDFEGKSNFLADILAKLNNRRLIFIECCR